MEGLEGVVGVDEGRREGLSLLFLVFADLTQLDNQGSLLTFLLLSRPFICFDFVPFFFIFTFLPLGFPTIYGWCVCERVLRAREGKRKEKLPLLHVMIVVQRLLFFF